MAKHDFVFELIRSLSKPEKRHFKMFASRYKASNEKKYLSLFKVFEKSNTSDTAEISRRLKAESYSGQLANDKHYLSEMLMSSLRQFHAETSIQHQLGTELLSVELLQNKGLFHHALKKVQRVKKEAIKYELLTTWLEAINAEKNIRYSNSIHWLENAPGLFNETNEVLGKIAALNQIDQRRVELLQLATVKGRPQNESEREEWNRRLAEFDPAISVTGLLSEKSIRLRAKAYGLFVMREIELANILNRERHQLFRAHPFLVEKSPFDYVFFIFFYISSTTQLGNYEEASQLLDEVRELRTKYEEGMFPSVCREIDERLLPIQMYVYGKMGKHELIREMEHDAELFFKNIKPSIKGVFIFNMSSSYMVDGNYKKIVHWTHREVSSDKGKDNYLIYIVNRLMQIIAHIELNEYAVATSLAQSALRYVLQRKGSTDTIDSDLIGVLLKCAGTDNLERRKLLVVDLLQRNSSNPAFENAEEYQPIRLWLRKVSGL